MKLIAVIGTRPQYIKHSAFANEVNKHNDIELITIDTGQHYDQNMSKVFIDDFKLDTIKYNLGIKSKLHGEQTALMLTKIEQILITEKPNFVIVYGDTNSTLAGAIAAAKLKIRIVHIEAGMRNFNLNVPEEINRTVTDRLSFYKIAPSAAAFNNLVNENLKDGSYMYGDITTDLIYNRVKNNSTPTNKSTYYFSTIHRPYNTDEKDRVLDVLSNLDKLDQMVILPLHPRTKNAMETWGINRNDYKNIQFVKPLSFFETIDYISNAKCVITDSGGVQKEAYILKKACISILPSTPWIESLIGNWNQLVFQNLNELQEKINNAPDLELYKKHYFGNGKVANKVVSLLTSEK